MYVCVCMNVCVCFNPFNIIQVRQRFQSLKNPFRMRSVAWGSFDSFYAPTNVANGTSNYTPVTNYNGPLSTSSTSGLGSSPVVWPEGYCVGPPLSEGYKLLMGPLAPNSPTSLPFGFASIAKIQLHKRAKQIDRQTDKLLKLFNVFYSLTLGTYINKHNDVIDRYRHTCRLVLPNLFSNTAHFLGTARQTAHCIYGIYFIYKIYVWCIGTNMYYIILWWSGIVTEYRKSNVLNDSWKLHWDFSNFWFPAFCRGHFYHSRGTLLCRGTQVGKHWTVDGQRDSERKRNIGSAIETLA